MMSMNMLTEFIMRKMKSAKYKILGDGTYFGEIPGMKGVWGNAKNLEDCRTELREVFEDWILFKIYDHERIPGLPRNLGRRVSARK